MLAIVVINEQYHKTRKLQRIIQNKLEPPPTSNIIELNNKPRGKFRALLKDYSQYHLYLSFFFLGERTHYSRIRRLTICYAAVITCLAANGLCYGEGKASNLIKWIISSLVCNVVQAPFIGSFRWSFSSTAPKGHSNDKEYISSKDGEVIGEKIEIIEEKEVTTPNQITKEIMIVIEADADSSEDIKDGTSTSECGSLDDLEAAIVRKPLTFRQKCEKVSEFILDVCDDLAESFVQKFENTEPTWEMAFTFLTSSIIYFTVLIALLYMLPLNFSYVTINHQCVIFVLFVGFYFGHLEFLYLKLRVKKYKEGYMKDWRVGKTTIIVSVVALFILAGLVTGIWVLDHAIPVLVPYNHPLHAYIFTLSFTVSLLFAMRFVGLCLAIRMPGLKRDEPTQILEQPKYTFSSRMMYVHYMLMALFIIIIISVVFLYGAHFHSRGLQWSWLTTSFMGLAFYIFIRLPLTHIFTYVLYGAFVKTMEIALFPENERECDVIEKENQCKAST
ncbi:hypothetical protein AKO1_013169 [Acrasis kona]|uniref:Uncharacterized protein n=1 Tax=Acrasis kona TaxID=1008807 RepID=A0AAW2YYI4_9EUKA